MSEPISLFKSIRGHRGTVNSVAFSSNGTQITTSSNDETVMVWTLTPSFRSYRWTGHTDKVVDVTFHPDGGHVASVSRDSTVRIWKTCVTPVPLVISGLASPLRCVAWSCHGEQLAIAGDDKTIRVYSIESLIAPTKTTKTKEISASSAGVRFSHSFQGHNHWVNTICFQPGDCALLASGGEDGRLCLFDKRVGPKPIYSKKESGGAIYSMDYSPDGKFIVTGSKDGKVRLYDLESTQLVALFEGHKGPVRSVCFGFGSLSFLIASASDDTSCRVWSVTEGCLLYTLYGHNAPVSGVAFSQVEEQDSMLLATSGGDSVFLWKVNIGLVTEESASRAAVPAVEDIDEEVEEVEEEEEPQVYGFDRDNVVSLGTGKFAKTLESIPDNIMYALESISGQIDLIHRRLDVLDNRISIVEDKL
ncbi:hypothetical protein P9112_014723 [Eukaryota sp. TZLM1-RC]